MLNKNTNMDYSKTTYEDLNLYYPGVPKPPAGHKMEVIGWGDTSRECNPPEEMYRWPVGGTDSRWWTTHVTRASDVNFFYIKMVPIEEDTPVDKDLPFDEREGWSMFVDDDTFMIQRLDSEEAFKWDSEAIAYVRQQALAGSLFHMKALEAHGRRCSDLCYWVHKFAIHDGMVDVKVVLDTAEPYVYLVDLDDLTPAVVSEATQAVERRLAMETLATGIENIHLPYTVVVDGIDVKLEYEVGFHINVERHIYDARRKAATSKLEVGDEWGVTTGEFATCPVCGSEEISGDGVEVGSEECWQEVTCGICYSYWKEVYKLDFRMLQTKGDFDG